jgi:hypothetical protein
MRIELSEAIKFIEAVKSTEATKSIESAKLTASVSSETKHLGLWILGYWEFERPVVR